MDAPVPLDAIRASLDGAIPATLATCAADGMPNATYVSQVQYVDPQHVALSFQFFSKTRENILANPQATAFVIDPVTAAAHRLALLYLRTETEGPLFQSMKAKIAGIASHTGMAGVFRLQGADIYRVLSVERVPGRVRERPAPRRNLLHALRTAIARLDACADLDALFDQLMALLPSEFGVTHALLLMADASRERLYTVASRGYAATGVGSEIAFGEGVIGVAAQHRAPIRIGHFSLEYRYGRAARATAAAHDLPLEAEIPFPGLAEPHSQLAVPLLAGDQLLGVLCVESLSDRRFSDDDEDALVALTGHLSLLVRAMQCDIEVDAGAGPGAGAPGAAAASTGAPARTAPAPGPALEVRHFALDDSVFIGGDYLIKGVPGAILWKLLRAWQATGRADWSNRELRLAAAELRLPEVTDNLESRLLLLTRRLGERCPAIGLEKTGRGQFRLRVERALRLEDVPAEG